MRTHTHTRKFTQPVKDDIGDKSVFQFQALPEAEKEAKRCVTASGNSQADGLHIAAASYSGTAMGIRALVARVRAAMEGK